MSGDEQSVPRHSEDSEDPARADAAGSHAGGPSGVTGGAGVADGQTSLRVFAAGLPDAGHERLRSAGDFEVFGDVEQVETADAAVISTRLPRGQLRPILTALRQAGDKPFVALAHTGGEGMAVEVMRTGGVGILAEGNEAALPALLDGRVHDQSMVEVYDRQLSQSAALDPMRGRDRSTGLPGASAFEQRVGDLVVGGDVPRVMMLRVLGLREPGGRLSSVGSTLLRRRLAMSLRQLAKPHGAELYSLDEADFGLISPDLSSSRAEELARQMAALTETFAPHGGQVLALAAGHAGPEASIDLAPLTDVARRALQVAAGEKRSNVVTAEKLALGVSSTTELEAVQQAVSWVERHARYAEGHAQRVVEWSGEIAWQLGLEGQARSRVQLAGFSHDAGLVSLPKECLADPAALEGELLEAYRSHPVRGSDWLRASAGAEVADAIRAHHENWDGSGFPDGLSGEEIPLAARIIRVADMLDGLVQGTDPAIRQPLPAPAGLVVLDERAGSELDPNVVEVAIPILDKLLSNREG